METLLTFVFFSPVIAGLVFSIVLAIKLITFGRKNKMEYDDVQCLEEEVPCENCGFLISEDEYYSNGGLCDNCYKQNIVNNR